jgi:cell division protein FtsW
LDFRAIIDTRRLEGADMGLFVAVLVLAVTGLAMSYSASAVIALKTYGDSFYFLKKQFIWFASGIVVMLVVQEIDYRVYSKFTKLMLFASLVMLILVLVPGIGRSVKGSVRWFSFGFLSIQPSEFVKLFIVIYLAKVFSSETKDQIMQLVIPMLLIAAMFILIMVQPDFGTAMEILAVSVIILFVSGFPMIYILALSVISVPMFYILIYQVDYRKGRFLAYMNPWTDRFGSGYHIIQSFIAFKKGGLAGAGLGNGTQKLSRLPEPHTDFIYAVIAEEAGLIGTLAVLFLFAVLLWRGIVIAINAPDSFGRLLAIGLTLMVVIQAMINFGVVMGSLPATGIPLPFISYGGSSLLTSLTAAGILLNISRYHKTTRDDLPVNNEVFA